MLELTSDAPPKTNDRPGPCTTCGATVATGEGALWWEAGPDDGGDVGGRTPAGWRVTHLDPAVCGAAKADKAKRDERRERERYEKAKQARATFEAERLELRATVEKFVAEHGLVPRPHRLVPYNGDKDVLVRQEVCVSPMNIAGAHTETLFEKSIYPANGGHSTGWFGSVDMWEKGIVALFGPNEGTAEAWASPSLIEEGLRRYRISQWWTEGAYGIDSYPGPGVPEADLTEEERAEVAVLFARKAAVKANRTMEQLKRQIEAHTSIARLVNMHEGTLAIEINPSDVAAYVAKPETPITATVVVTFPAAAYDAKGKLRRIVGKWVPEEVRIHNGFTVKVVVATPEAK